MTLVDLAVESPEHTILDDGGAPGSDATEPEVSLDDTSEASFDGTSHEDPVVEATALTHVVTRSFFGGGHDRFIGEVVDASNWRMADVLVGERRLRVFSREDPEPIFDGQGRYFIDDTSLLAYIDTLTEEPLAP